VAGFAIQLGVVAALTAGGSAAVMATLLGVEATILHNFFWHERWTWADRPAAGRDRLARLGRFHFANGLVSIAGNVAIVFFLAPVAAGFSRTYGLVGANAIAVLTCSLVNFAAGDRLVFATRLRAAQSSPTSP
jgi:putative flippase GtrA